MFIPKTQDPQQSEECGATEPCQRKESHALGSLGKTVAARSQRALSCTPPPPRRVFGGSGSHAVRHMGRVARNQWLAFHEWHAFREGEGGRSAGVFGGPAIQYQPLFQFLPSWCLSFVFVAGEERPGRGRALQHQEPQTRPRIEGTECTQTANHTLVAWGGPWGRLGHCHTTLFECARPCLATGLGFHCTQDNGMSQGVRTDSCQRGSQDEDLSDLKRGPRTPDHHHPQSWCQIRSGACTG